MSELEKKTVYILGAKHPVKEYIHHPLTSPAQMALMAKLVQGAGVDSIFNEGDNEPKCKAIEVTANYYANKPDQLNHDINYAFETRDFERWHGFLQVRMILKLRKEGHSIHIKPAEVNRDSIECTVNFLANNATKKDWELLYIYGIEVLKIMPADMTKYLEEIAKDGNAVEKFFNLLMDVRIHYGDKEMAKNINAFGSAKNVLLVGSGHTQSGWEDQFNTWRLEVESIPGKNIVVISGFLPDSMRSRISRFTIPESNAKVITKQVKFVT